MFQTSLSVILSVTVTSLQHDPYIYNYQYNEQISSS